MGWAVDESFGVAMIGVVERALLDCSDRLGAAVEHVGGDVSVQPAVLMLVVVPVDEVTAPVARM